MTTKVRVVLTGAAGQIGYALLFRIASGQMFGENQKVDLVLLELERSLPMLEGVVMELQDCAFPLLNSITTTSDTEQAMKGAQWVLLVGAAPRKEGMERSDLLELNGGIFKGQGAAINANAASDVRVLVVGNPCNTNAYIAMKNAPDVPNDRFFAMTMLDQLRAKAQLAIKAKVPVTEVRDMIIWGNHSATQFPDFYHAKIKGQEATDLLDLKWLKETFVETVQKRGAAVIKARGASSAASAANGIVESVRSIINDTAADDSYSMCLCSEGQYGVDEELIFSFPCKTEGGTLKVIEGIKHGDNANQKFQTTLNELRSERDIVQSKKLVP